MTEQRIEIIIDESGKISASTEGFKGETCLEKLQDLLGDLAELESHEKSDEWYQEEKITTTATNKQKLSGG